MRTPLRIYDEADERGPGHVFDDDMRLILLLFKISFQALIFLSVAALRRWRFMLR